MLHFGDCRDAKDPSVVAVIAQVACRYVMGSVAVKEWPDGDISVARLYVDPGWRRQGIARQMMRRVFELYPFSGVWLYAGPYAGLDSTRPGPGTDVLLEFYRSLGFMTTTDDFGNPAMVRKGQR